jgi:PhzF family phenazine biosynthesis protein
MIIKKYHVDAFADRLFSGNPAAVCLVEEFLSDDLMIKIAAEHNLAETAFIVAKNNHFLIRWFTPTVEVDLCGHATLASAYVIFNHSGYTGKTIHFQTQTSGSLFVHEADDIISMDFPVDIPIRLTNHETVDLGLSYHVPELHRASTKYLAVLNSEKEIHALNPHMESLMNLDREGVIFTAPGDEVDFVSRFFCPKIGIDEDPVTGSAHTVLIPYWSDRLQKKSLIGRQLSYRSGTVYCQMNGDRVQISGHATLYSQGEIYL